MTTQTEALKLALEALEDRASLMKWQIARDAVKEALAQPEQEPVAQWQKRHIEQTDGMWCDTNEADAKWWLAQTTLHGWEVRKVYTTPPQRKPLEEPLVGTLLYLFQEWKEDHLSQSNYIDCVEGIKAAHGIKGEA